MAESDDILRAAKDAFRLAEEAEDDNRREAEDDIRFARLGEQWPAKVVEERQKEGRPALTINKLPAFIRQVVNDARQNKPSIKVHPVDSNADKATAEIYDGLIRNIETTSSADVAYDTATESAVTGGFGYFRIGLDYAFEDTFDLDIKIERIGNPFSVYGDPHSTAADSSDWNSAFIVEMMSKDAFKRAYPKATQTNWDGDDWQDMATPWLEDEQVMVAEWWVREEYEKEVLLFADGSVFSLDELKRQPELFAAYQAKALQPVQTRTAKCHRVVQHILTGAEVLATNPWPGQFIPIVPVYGDEINVKGKRYFRSLINPAKDSQRYFNAWRSTSMELAALSPRVPFIGPKGFAKSDPNWSLANRANIPYLEYDVVPGMAAGPARQPIDVGPAAGALQEALNASDDMKAIMGLYDASLGARSNETSGRAIMARQREGDVSTFHFQDNMTRAVRHGGRIVVDLIPKVYTKDRIVRVLGEDGKVATVPLGQPQPVMGPDGQPQMQENPETGAVEPVTRVYDLAAGKYDLSVKAGPSFTTRREEAAVQMTEMIRAFPQSAIVVGPELAKNLDWPGADKIAERLEQMAPKPNGGIPPEVQKQIADGLEELKQTKAENDSLKADKSLEAVKMQHEQQQASLDHELAMQKLALEARKMSLEEQKLGVQQYEAETARIAAMKPPEPPRTAPRPAA